MTIEIRLAAELGEDTRKKISEIFVDGFGEHFTYFSEDSEKLAKAFEHMFVLDVFYVAIIDGEIVGISACNDGSVYSIKHNRKDLIKHFGIIKGMVANYVFKKEFQKNPYEITDTMASIEFVATSRKHRGKGVAAAIINYLFTLPEYGEYVLEVADTNSNAIRLYEKLGFKEMNRIKQKHSKRSGINELVYMKYVKPQIK